MKTTNTRSCQGKVVGVQNGSFRAGAPWSDGCEWLSPQDEATATQLWMRGPIPMQASRPDDATPKTDDTMQLWWRSPIQHQPSWPAPGLAVPHNYNKPAAIEDAVRCQKPYIFRSPTESEGMTKMLDKTSFDPQTYKRNFPLKDSWRSRNDIGDDVMSGPFDVPESFFKQLCDKFSTLPERKKDTLVSHYPQFSYGADAGHENYKQDELLADYDKAEGRQMRDLVNVKLVDDPATPFDRSGYALLDAKFVHNKAGADAQPFHVDFSGEKDVLIMFVALTPYTADNTTEYKNAAGQTVRPTMEAGQMIIMSPGTVHRRGPAPKERIYFMCTYVASDRA